MFDTEMMALFLAVIALYQGESPYNLDTTEGYTDNPEYRDTTTRYVLTKGTTVVNISVHPYARQVWVEVRQDVQTPYGLSRGEVTEERYFERMEEVADFKKELEEIKQVVY